MAKKKASGSTAQVTKKPGKRLGLKISGGQKVKTGQIIVRQRGTAFHPGQGVGKGKDHSLFALKDGTLKFTKRLGKQIIFIS